jgi:hypothetical protein
VEDGGVLGVEDVGPFEVEDGGLLGVEDGGLLEVDDGGPLGVDDGGALEVEDGGVPGVGDGCPEGGGGSPADTVSTVAPVVAVWVSTAS